MYDPDPVIRSTRRDLLTRLDLVFMDTTSLYFEGAGGQTLGQHGYSKDHRPDLRQMILAVLIDGAGRPVCSEMWPGNTADVTTVDVVAAPTSVATGCSTAKRFPNMIGKDLADGSAMYNQWLAKFDECFGVGSPQRGSTDMPNACTTDASLHGTIKTPSPAPGAVIEPGSTYSLSVTLWEPPQLCPTPTTTPPPPSTNVDETFPSTTWVPGG